jgi:ABC-type Fe3+-siderophore transport system permease subunit
MNTVQALFWLLDKLDKAVWYGVGVILLWLVILLVRWWRYR